MDSKCIVMKININNCAFRGSENKLISFGGFWKRHQTGGPHVDSRWWGCQVRRSLRGLSWPGSLVLPSLLETSWHKDNSDQIWTQTSALALLSGCWVSEQQRGRLSTSCAGCGAGVNLTRSCALSPFGFICWGSV